MASWITGALSRTFGWFRTPEPSRPVPRSTPYRDSGVPESGSDSEYEDGVETPRVSRINTMSPMPRPVASPGVSSRSHMKVDQFNGHTDLLDYLQHFERVATWNRWSPDDKAMQLAMALSGDARTILGDLPSWATNDYGPLVKALSSPMRVTILA